MLSKRIFVVMFLLVFLLLVGCAPSAPPIDENQAPVIVSVPTTNAKVGVGYIYNVGATDPDEDSLTYGLVINPTNMSINQFTGVITWTPTSSGSFGVIVKVSDGALSVTQSFNILVEAVTDPCVPPCPEPDPCVPPCPTPQEVKLISIVVVPKTMTLFVGETEEIVSVTAHYSDGSTFVIDQPGYDYGNGSDDDSVATVSVIHVVTAVAKGTATITVMYEDKTDVIEVTVAEVEVIGIEVSPDTMTLLNGGTQFLIVTAHYNNGSTAVVTFDCDYVSNYPGIASINFLSLVEALSFGKATITVTYTPGGTSFVDTVEVTVGPVHNVTQDSFHNTIQAAIGAAFAYDSIEVAPGIYPEDVFTNVNGLTFKSVEKYGAEIRGKVIINSDAVTVEDFYINLDTAINLPPVDLMEIDGVTIIGNKIEGGSNYGGINSWVGPNGVGGLVSIENNEIIKGCIGPYFESKAASVTIRNNTLTGPADEGIWTVHNLNAFLTIENNAVIGAGSTDVKIVDKPLSINGVAIGTDMAQEILDSNLGINSVYLEWIPEYLTR